MMTMRLAHVYLVECYGADGRLKWAEQARNIVVNEGLDDVLDKFYKGSAYTAAHYVGLAGTAPSFAAGDTMASHGGWTEIADYDEAVRQTLTMGTVASQSVDNSSSKAVFSVNATVTIGGGFVSTDSTKSGSTGTLVGGAAFDGGDQAAVSGDTLNVTVTATMSSA